MYPSQGWSNMLSDSGTARIVFPGVLGLRFCAFTQSTQVQFPVKEEYFPPSFQLAPCGEGWYHSPTAPAVVKQATATPTREDL